jgi:hypothetical protein
VGSGRADPHHNSHDAPAFTLSLAAGTNTVRWLPVAAAPLVPAARVWFRGRQRVPASRPAPQSVFHWPRLSPPPTEVRPTRPADVDAIHSAKQAAWESLFSYAVSILNALSFTESEPTRDHRNAPR